MEADGAQARRLLHSYTERTLQDVWRRPDGGPDGLEDASAGALLAQLRQVVRTLSPADASQRWLQGQALQTTASLQRQRWQLIEQTGPTVRPVVLVIVVSWIVVIFASFGLNAPRNATVTAAFAVCSLAIGGAIFDFGDGQPAGGPAAHLRPADAAGTRLYGALMPQHLEQRERRSGFSPLDAASLACDWRSARRRSWMIDMVALRSRAPPDMSPRVRLAARLLPFR